MTNRIVNLNGQIVSENQAQISVFDRGFLYGDSLYEVVRTYGQRPLAIREHLQRLENSAHLCRMKLDQDHSTYERAIRSTIEASSQNHDSEVYCRLVVTRGHGRIGFGLSFLDSPTQYLVIAQPLAEFSAEEVQRGLRLSVSSRLRNPVEALDPAMKSGNYLNCLLATLEAHEKGFDDCLLCNSDGHVTEGSVFNIWYIKRGILVTPPLDIGILDGITRRGVINLAKEMGFPVREVRFSRERLFEADEVFITGTTKEVFPVTQVDHRVLSGGQAGAKTLELRQAFRKWAEEAAERIASEGSS